MPTMQEALTQFNAAANAAAHESDDASATAPVPGVIALAPAPAPLPPPVVMPMSKAKPPAAERDPVKASGGKLEIDSTAHLVAARIKVLGVRQRTVKKEEETHGDITTKTREVERDFVESEYATACTLADRLRGMVRRATLSTPLGLMTDAERANQLRAAIVAAGPDVRDWNKQARTHKVRCEVMVVPVGPALDGIADTLADALRTALVAVSEAVRSGEFNAVRSALQRYANVDALVIGLMRDAVRDVMEGARKALNSMKARAKKGESVAAIAKTPSPEMHEALQRVDGCESMLLSVAPAAMPIED